MRWAWRRPGAALDQRREQMSETDQAHEAVEHLDGADAAAIDRPGFDRRAFLRRTALTGVRRRLGQHAAGRVRVAAPRAAAAAVGERVRLAPELQIRVRQPRHDEPVLHADAVRHRRRVQAARLHLPVDRLGKQQRQPDGQRAEQRRRRQSGRHRRRADRPARVQRAGRNGAQGGHPGRRLQRRRGRATRGSPTSART